MKHRKHTAFRPPPPPSVQGISTTPRLRIASYHRVSTLLDRQDPTLARDQLREHAARIGELVMEIEERGSGKRDRTRPGLLQIMEAARRRRFDVLVFWRLDRLGRSTLDLHNIAATLSAYGVELSCVTQPGIDTRTPTGKLLFAVLSALAEHERDTIRERVLLGLERARKAGKRLGRPRAPSPSVAEVVACRRRGMSWAQTAKHLGCSINIARLRAAEHRRAQQ